MERVKDYLLLNCVPIYAEKQMCDFFIDTDSLSVFFFSFLECVCVCEYAP